MASRPAFLKREPGLARPRPNPASRPPLRRPPKSDPRSPQWRPAPKIPKPTPNKPLFPGMPKPKYPVFGKRPAHLPLPAGWAGRLRPIMPFLRFHPAMMLPFLAMDAWDLWNRFYRPFNITGYRRRDDLECTQPVYVRYDRISEFTYPCGSGRFAGTPGPVAEWTFPETPIRSRLYEWWTHHTGNRYISRVPWDRIPGHPGPFKVEPEQDIPYIQPDPLELPYPYPFAPTPVPVSRPLTRPNQEPGYQPEPSPRPALRPLPRPPGLVAPIPAINWRPGSMPEAGFHERRPPTKTEAEKKKRLKPGTSAAWLAFMNKAIGSYTEVDDTLSALYKGLPWHLRRWRGRDGVWRDRDIRSDTRAQRLYELLGKLDVEKAIEEVIKQQLTDAAFGTVGNKLKKRAKDLGDEGLWAGNTGFQQGGANRQDTWDEAYEKLKKEAADKVKTRQYTVKIRVGPGMYRYETRTRPVTQIPWFKQESLYPRMARPGMAEWWTLTAAEKAARKKNVKAFYYAKTRTPRP